MDSGPVDQDGDAGLRSLDASHPRTCGVNVESNCHLEMTIIAPSPTWGELTEIFRIVPLELY
jgi:hypothetical protein